MFYKKIAMMMLCGVQMAWATQDQAVQAPVTPEGQPTVNTVVQVPQQEQPVVKQLVDADKAAITVSDNQEKPAFEKEFVQDRKVTSQERVGLPSYVDKQWQETLAALKNIETKSLKGIRLGLTIINRASVEQAAVAGAVSMLLFPLTTTGIVATGLAVAGAKKVAKSKTFYMCKNYGAEHIVNPVRTKLNEPFVSDHLKWWL